MSYVGVVSAQSPSNDLGNGSLLSITTTKSAFSAGDMIDIHGNSLPNYHVELTLVGPNGVTQDTRSTFSDRDGQFSSYLLIPKYAQGGTWKILGKSGTYNAELDFDIFEPQSGTTCQGCFLGMLNSTKPSVEPKNVVESPLKQFKSGISVHYITCKESLHLIIKAENGTPACVKIETGKILVKRGWATTFGTGISTNEYYTSCDTPYPQNGTGVAVLYMPVNSIGKICVKYSNYNDFPVEPAYGISIVDPNNSNQKATGITIWNDLKNNPILKENSTVVNYWIKTGNQTGFYGLTVSSCIWTPFAVGYDNNSRIVASDFPFVGVTVSCPAIDYGSDIDGLTGIGVKYIP